MAPVELDSSTSLLPSIFFGAHGFWAVWLSGIVLTTIYESYVALPVSSAIRNRQSSRNKHVQVFLALVVGSLASALYYGKKLVELSYGVWATERGIELPDSYFGERGAFRGGEHPGRMHIARWLNDTPFYYDSLEIVAEKARYFWWGQQVNLALVCWSLYLAIEGRRRKIRHLWSFLALAHLVNLSYAQNLFFLAVLLTPVPLPDNAGDFRRGPSAITRRSFSRLVPEKPEGFLPSPNVYIAPLVLAFTATFLVPFAANTPSFTTVSLVARGLPFYFLAVPYIIPESWGTIHADPHSSYGTYTRLFRSVSVVSTLLHLKSTTLALFLNLPEAVEHRHSLLHPFATEERSTFVRGYTAVNMLIGAFREHPAVAIVGWDVIFSGFSLGIWSAIRGLQPSEILGSSSLFSEPPEIEPQLVIESKPAQIGTRKASGRQIKQAPEYDDEDGIVVATPVPRKRGRPAKKSLAVKEEALDATYQPETDEPIAEGDEEVEADWESGALSWGLMSAFGLATASSGIYGAEIRAR